LHQNYLHNKLSKIIQKYSKILPMNSSPHFYAVIIGSEILNRRRVDKHFDYLSLALQDKGFSLFASLTIKDDKTLITQTLEMVKSDPNAMMFCFGGIGSTPDDLTRQLAANVFQDGKLYRHSQFEKDIITRLEERAYPHPIRMSDLPYGANLLHNPINNMSGFSLDDRYFFMPGFPEMAQPMMDTIVNSFLPQATKMFTKGFIARCGESVLTTLMQEVPADIDLSSLPMMGDTSAEVEIQLSSSDKAKVEKYYTLFRDFLDKENIEHKPL
jgi:molybdopterin-biosynthesis enzyme MoeA-like protein